MTCLAVLLRHKLHESLPSVTCPEMDMSCNLSLLLPMPEVEVSSSLCYDDCNKNVVRDINFRVYYTMPRSVQLNVS